MGVRLKKRLGQHLLEDHVVLEAIADAAGVCPGDQVLEIGAGPGTLTDVLAGRVTRRGRVLTVELDRSWQPDVEHVRARHPHVEVVWGDALDLDLDGLPGDVGCWKCVANIPYYITSPLVQKLVDARRHFVLLALLMQKEVAERLNSTHGRDVGMLSYFIQYHVRSEVALAVPAAAFRPPPKVDSALLVLRPRDVPPVDVPFAAMRPIIQTAFAARRKMLRGTLRALAGPQDDVEAWLSRARVDPRSRPEQLDLEAYARLARTRT